jgi:ABC-type thiamine transport system substrate-binding protein
MQALEEKNILGAFDPPSAKGYPRQFRDPQQKMTAWRVLPYGINYNYQLLKAEEAPQSFEELLAAKWKGKFGIANPGIHVTTLQFVLSLEKLYGPKWLKIVEGWSKQEPRLARGLADLIQPMTSGEVPLTIGYIKDKFQYSGPIEYVRMNRYLASWALSESTDKHPMSMPRVSLPISSSALSRKEFSVSLGNTCFIRKSITNSRKTLKTIRSS